MIPLTLLFLAQKRNLLIPLELSRVMHQGSDYVERSFELSRSVLETSPLAIDIQTDSHERRNRGLRMDWLELEAVDSRSRFIPVGRTVLWSALLSAVFALLALVTFERRSATVAGAAVPLGLALYGGFAGSFPLAHMVTSIGPFTLAVLGAAIVIRVTVWKSRGGRSGWIPLVTALAFLIRVGGVFHPRFYHPRSARTCRHGAGGNLPWCINTGKSLIPLTLRFFAQKRNLLIPLELSRVMHQGSERPVVHRQNCSAHEIKDLRSA